MVEIDQPIKPGAAIPYMTYELFRKINDDAKAAGRAHAKPEVLRLFLDKDCKYPVVRPQMIDGDEEYLTTNVILSSKGDLVSLSMKPDVYSSLPTVKWGNDEQA